MNKERLLNTFLELVQIDSPSTEEAAVAAYCKAALEQAGCTVHIDNTMALTGSNTGNLIATLSGTRPGKLYFSAHMDTVCPGKGIRPQIKDGIIHAAGDTILGSDDKAGIAAIIEMIRSLSEEGEPHPQIGVLLSVCEETNLLGALAMETTDFNNEPCFVLDCVGKPGIAVIGAPFYHKFEATFNGKAAHAGIEPEKGVSAILIAAKALANMELGRLGPNTTANVGTIAGGTATNIVPDICTLSGEFRTMEEPEAARIKAQLEAAMQDAVAAMGGEVAITWGETYKGYLIKEDNPCVQLVLEQARLLNLEAKTMISGGCSDANIFVDKGLRALVLSVGMTDVHGLDERIAVCDLENLALLVIAIACAYTPEEAFVQNVGL